MSETQQEMDILGNKRFSGENKNSDAACKICGSESLTIYLHTAKCKNCGVLLYYPYPEVDSLETETSPELIDQYKKNWLYWYRRAAKLNHRNFTNMFLFTIKKPEDIFSDPVKILDYGGGGGQFALICKSFLPLSEVFIVDINDYALIDEYKSMNTQIKWKDFANDTTTFNYIFLNDVFEHVSDPVQTLQILSGKLNTGGKVFIDTPRQFWVYPFFKFLYTPLYAKLLAGTVSRVHLQIWTEKSFYYVAEKAGFKMEKYIELNEFTMKVEHYLKNIGVTGKLAVFAARIFYKVAKGIARNKIMCVLVKE